MPSSILAPVPIQQFFDANGKPVSGGQVSFYQAGTTTPQPAYADPGLTTPLANPVILDAAGRPATTSGPTELWLDGSLAYKEVLATAGGQTIWTADQVGLQAAPSSEILTITGSGTINNYPLDGTKRSHVLFFSNTADVTLSGFGFAVAPAIGDRILMLGSSSTGNIYLVNNSANSGHVFANTVVSAPTPVSGVGGRAEYIYFGSNRWALLSHQQGGWITPPFVASNFVGSSGLTWTVGAVQVGRSAYVLVGRTLQLSLLVSGSTLAGSGSALQVLNGAWGGFSSVSVSDMSPIPYLLDGSGSVPGVGYPVSATVAQINKTSGAALVAGTCSIEGSLRFEVS